MQDVPCLRIFGPSINIILVACIQNKLCTLWFVFFNIFFCLDINECLEEENLNDCDGNATCIDTDGGFNCNCNVGYTGNGTEGNCLGMDNLTVGTFSLLHSTLDLTYAMPIMIYLG